MTPYVLIVEDEDALATLLQYNLEKEGYQVALAGDGEEALTQIDERLPDVVVLDWMLPKVSGIEVCRRLRSAAKTRNLPVVMLTALHDKPCKYANGDYLTLLSVLNKQDYARLHNYPIVVATRLADPTLHNMWNKIGWILKCFEDYPDADW